MKVLDFFSVIWQFGYKLILYLRWLLNFVYGKFAYLAFEFLFAIVTCQMQKLRRIIILKHIFIRFLVRPFIRESEICYPQSLRILFNQLETDQFLMGFDFMHFEVF